MKNHAHTVPANLPAERAVLGAVLGDEAESAQILSDVIDSGLVVEDFFLSDHQRIFLAILKLREKNAPIDFISIAEQLGNSQADYVVLGSLIDGTVIEANHVLYHAGVIRRKARQRKLLKLGEWLLDSVNDRTEPDQMIEQLLERIEQCRT